MVICKFFPNCRNGNSCNFEHIYSNSHFSRGNSQQYYASNSFHHNKQPAPQKPAGNTMDLSEVMKVVVQEVIQAEKGGQWPLSCFSPIKERPCFPGMLDYSPEEIRWKMYEANKNGTLAECQRQIKELYETSKQKRNYLKNPNGEIYAVIDKCYGNRSDSNTGSSTFSVDNTRTQNSTFGFSPQPFGNSQQNAQTAVSNPDFKFSLTQLQSTNFQTPQLANNQPSIFGGMGNSGTAPQGFASISQNIPALQTTPQNAFGRTVAGNVFASAEVTQVQSTNMFGAAQTKPGSVFGGSGTAQPQLNSIFGGAGAGQMPPVSGVFGGGAPLQGVFGENAAASMTSNKVFGDTASMPSGSVFGRSDAVSASSAFGTMNNVITPSESVFGRANPAVSSGSTFGETNVFGSSGSLSKPQSNVLDSWLYTQKEELTQEELLAFSANTFTLGKVPIKPPPKELC